MKATIANSSCMNFILYARCQRSVQSQLNPKKPQGLNFHSVDMFDGDLTIIFRPDIYVYLFQNVT